MNGLEQERGAFVAACRTQLESWTGEHERALAEARSQVTELSHRLVVAVRRADEAQVLYDATKRRLDQADVHLSDEYDSLSRLPGVADLRLEPSGVVLATDPVYLTHEGRRYHIGRFRIVLGLNGDIVAHNQENQKIKPMWDHPHVQNRIPCLGNVTPGLMKLLGEYELAAAAQVMLSFLGSYDPETAYCPLDLWEEVSGDG